MDSFEQMIDYIKMNMLESSSQREVLKNFSGKIIGYIDIKPNGDQELKNYSGLILGRYVAQSNSTQNYSGTILSRGNTLTMLLK